MTEIEIMIIQELALELRVELMGISPARTSASEADGEGAAPSSPAINHAELSLEFMARFPKIRASLAK